MKTDTSFYTIIQLIISPSVRGDRHRLWSIFSLLSTILHQLKTQARTYTCTDLKKSVIQRIQFFYLKNSFFLKPGSLLRNCFLTHCCILFISYLWFFAFICTFLPVLTPIFIYFLVLYFLLLEGLLFLMFINLSWPRYKIAAIYFVPNVIHYSLLC